MKEVIEFFERLDQTSWSGEVEIKSAQGHAIVTIVQGKFLWAYRPLDRSLERLKRIQWLETPATPMKTWEELVLALIEMNEAQENRLVRLLKMDRLEVFFRIFFWSNVEIIPKENQGQMPNAETLGFYSLRGLDKLLVDAKSRLAEWPQMKEKMGTSKRVFISLVSSKISSEADLKSTYSIEELEILSACDGRNSVQDLIKNLPYGEFFTIRSLLDLWRRGAIRAKDEEGVNFSRIFEQDILTPLDLLGVVWAGLLAAIIFLALNMLMVPSPSINCDSSAISQALEGYRSQYEHYPLTLSELPASRIPESSASQFKYTLANAVSYELSCNAETAFSRQAQ